MKKIVKLLLLIPTIITPLTLINCSNSKNREKKRKIKSNLELINYEYLKLKDQHEKEITEFIEQVLNFKSLDETPNEAPRTAIIDGIEEHIKKIIDGLDQKTEQELIELEQKIEAISEKIKNNYK